MSVFKYYHGSTIGGSNCCEVEKNNMYLGEIRNENGIFRFYHNPSKIMIILNHSLEHADIEKLKALIEAKY